MQKILLFFLFSCLLKNEFVFWEHIVRVESGLFLREENEEEAVLRLRSKPFFKGVIFKIAAANINTIIPYFKCSYLARCHWILWDLFNHFP